MTSSVFSPGRRAAIALWLPLVGAGVAPGPVQAGDRLLATWGVQQVEGAGGGGLTPWATITGTGSSDQVGGSVVSTQASTQDGYRLKVVGAAIGVRDRVEISMARWSFKLSDDVVADKSLEMSVVGVKVKVTGDAVHDQDTWIPQVSVGTQYKMASDRAFLGVLSTTASLGVRAHEDVCQPDSRLAGPGQHRHQEKSARPVRVGPDRLLNAWAEPDIFVVARTPLSRALYIPFTPAQRGVYRGVPH